MQEAHFPKNERVLFLSIIEAAVHDAKETNPRVRQAALEWLMQYQADSPRICELAGVDSAITSGRISLPAFLLFFSPTC